MIPIILDTNIVLDLFVYSDPRYANIREGLQDKTLAWQATHAMRDELSHVLRYPQIVRRLVANGQAADEVLTLMDGFTTWHETSPKSPFTCKDKDDQIFIDLASKLQCQLISKDKAVLALRSRLARLGATVAVVWQPVKLPI